MITSTGDFSNFQKTDAFLILTDILMNCIQGRALCKCQYFNHCKHATGFCTLNCIKLQLRKPAKMEINLSLHCFQICYFFEISFFIRAAKMLSEMPHISFSQANPIDLVHTGAKSILYTYISEIYRSELYNQISSRKIQVTTTAFRKILRMRVRNCLYNQFLKHF